MDASAAPVTNPEGMWYFEELRMDKTEVAEDSDMRRMLAGLWFWFRRIAANMI